MDLKLPKRSVVLLDPETNKIFAENGKWKELPNDGQILKVEYKHNYSKYDK